MNNFRRRSLAKKERTIVLTYRYVDSFTPMSINITNGTFRIDQTVGSTAELSVTIGYTVTTYLYTRYDDGTVETSNPYTESGTATITEARMKDSWLGNTLVLWKDFELGDGCDCRVSLAEVNGLTGGVPLPEQSGDEITTRISVNGDYDMYIGFYIANTGTLYYVNIYYL